MKKFSILLVLSVFAQCVVFCQNEDFYSAESKEKPEKEHRVIDKWLFGGNLWMGFEKTTYIEIDPMALYKLTPRIMIGPGFTYTYQKYRDLKLSSSTYGVKAIGQYVLFKDLDESIHLNLDDIILQTEYEALNIERFNMTTFESKGRLWIDNLLIGGGIYQAFSDRGGISLLLLFDVTQNPYSPYSNPFLRLGLLF